MFKLIKELRKLVINQVYLFLFFKWENNCSGSLFFS